MHILDFKKPIRYNEFRGESGHTWETEKNETAIVSLPDQIDGGYCGNYGRGDTGHPEDQVQVGRHKNEATAGS